HDRPGAGRRRFRPPHPQGLHLRGDGVLGVRGDDQPVDQAALAAGGRRRSAACLIQPVPLSQAASSSIEYSGRSSTSQSDSGYFFTHSTASSSVATSHIWKSATSSLVSGKGPSMTVGLLPVNATRLAKRDGLSPPKIGSLMTPAAISAPMYSPIACISPGLGGTPASVSFVALPNTMTFIATLLVGVVYAPRTIEGTTSRQRTGKMSVRSVPQRP